MYVNLCGINKIHDSDFKVTNPNGIDYYFFLRVKTPTRFFLNGESYDAEANDVILFQKRNPLYYESVSETSYMDDFIFFDIEERDLEFWNQLPIKFNQFFRFPSGQSLLEIHQMLCMEFLNQTSFREESLHTLMRYFLVKLAENMNADYSGYEYAQLKRLHGLRSMIYTSPDRQWSVKEMADYMKLSPSYFQHFYKKVFHIPCMRDVFTSRMNYAKELLWTTNLSIKEIAEKCGYEYENYFSRHFKKQVGILPSEYRNHIR